MKQRFAHFIVARSKAILIIFIILALGCGALIPMVNVNKDMTKYLPKDSAMRHGLDLMKAEFGDENSSSLEIMFDDLQTPAQKDAILQKLQSMQYADSVDYDPANEDEDQYYNKGKYTRFIINCDYDQYSDEATVLWKNVKEAFADDHEIVLGGTINSANENNLPVWIVVIAVLLVVLILVIMASSWIEPLAFLITIGVAVLINMGTYIFFPSISKTTFGIVFILQLGLSMDYSIMLLNRYRQERRLCEDKYATMEKALSLSFGAITGSSLTTFAGLLALVFMSFTMGADIGLSLAKGVLISMFCIFTVLPALILGFDSLMLRTVKPTLPFDLPKLSGFQYRMRLPLTLLFAVMLVGSFGLRSGVDFSYSQSWLSGIDKVFGHTNTIVMMYDERDGEAAGQLAEDLDAKATVHSAVCYESTLGKQRTAYDMRDFIEDVQDEESDSGGSGADGSSYGDVDLSDSMVKLIYYDYHAGDPDFTMTIPQFISFLRGDVMNDPDYGDTIDQDARDQIDDMVKFTDRGALTTKKSASGLAHFFGMKKSQAEQLLLYYQIKNNKKGKKMSLPDFVSFLIDDVASDPEYGKMISKSQLTQLESMQIYTDKESMTAEMPFEDASQMLGIDPALFPEVPFETISVQALLTFILDDETIRSELPEQQIAQLQGLKAIIDTSVSGSKLSAKKMGSILGMKSSDVNKIYLLHQYEQGNTGSWKLTPQQFINFLVNKVLKDKSMKSRVGSSAADLKFAQKLINSVVSGRPFTYREMADFFSEYSGSGVSSADFDADNLSLLYTLYGSRHYYDDKWTMDLMQLVNHLDGNMLARPAFAKAMDAAQIRDVHDMREDMDEAAELLEGSHYGRMMITAVMEEDSDETRAFMDGLTAWTDSNFNEDMYMIGNTPMAYEMSKTFHHELNKITLITALFILIIVLLTFRSIATPVTLVLIIQCAVFLTMALLNCLHIDMQYLSLLVVQSIMMGATIDYAIIYTTYYIENRTVPSGGRSMNPREAIRASYKGSLQTILTSATILIAAVGVLSFAFADPAIRQICRILSVGCLIATILVIFILPGILAFLDRFVVGRRSSRPQ